MKDKNAKFQLSPNQLKNLEGNKTNKKKVCYCEDISDEPTLPKIEYNILPPQSNYRVPKPRRRIDRIADLIGTIVGLLIVGVCLFALFSFTSPSRIICGDQIGTFNNVKVYYNDGYTSCGDRNWSEDGKYSYGMKWQCVEFIRRYYYKALNHQMPNRWGNATDYFRYNIPSGSMNLERNLVQYHNGDTKPRINDILVWGGYHGHVAIVTAVLDNEWIQVIAQNTGKHCNTFIKVDKTKDGAYIIDKGHVSGLLRIEE